MDLQSVFRFCSTLAALSWLLLIVLGWKRWVPALVTGAIVPAALGILYALLLTCEVREAGRNLMSHSLGIPCLILTFLFGPVGLLLYLGLRFALRRRFTVAEEGTAAVRPY